MALSKQYCLSDSEVRGGVSCIAWASRKTEAPPPLQTGCSLKTPTGCFINVLPSAALIFLCLLSLHQDKESKIDFGKQKNRARHKVRIKYQSQFLRVRRRQMNKTIQGKQKNRSREAGELGEAK
jgi:hypothetical protein